MKITEKFYKVASPVNFKREITLANEVLNQLNSEFDTTVVITDNMSKYMVRELKLPVGRGTISGSCVTIPISGDTETIIKDICVIIDIAHLGKANGSTDKLTDNQIAITVAHEFGHVQQLLKYKHNRKYLLSMQDEEDPYDLSKFSIKYVTRMTEEFGAWIYAYNKLPHCINDTELLQEFLVNLGDFRLAGIAVQTPKIKKQEKVQIASSAVYSLVNGLAILKVIDISKQKLLSVIHNHDYGQPIINQMVQSMNSRSIDNILYAADGLNASTIEYTNTNILNEGVFKEATDSLAVITSVLRDNLK